MQPHEASLPPDLLAWTVVAIVLFRAWAMQQDHRKSMGRVSEALERAALALDRYVEAVQRGAPKPELATREHDAVQALDAALTLTEVEAGAPP